MVSGEVGGWSSGDWSLLGGSAISCSAPVGHDPMQDKHPTQAASTTTTGRFGCFRSLGFTAKGSNASKGQNGMHKSQPVQAESVMPTMACPMLWRQTPAF